MKPGIIYLVYSVYAGAGQLRITQKNKEEKRKKLLWDVNRPEASSYLKNNKTVLKKCRTFFSLFFPGVFFPLLGWRNSGGPGVNMVDANHANCVHRHRDAEPP